MRDEGPVVRGVRTVCNYFQPCAQGAPSLSLFHISCKACESEEKNEKGRKREEDQQGEERERKEHNRKNMTFASVLSQHTSTRGT